jgi:hypothetical protein
MERGVLMLRTDFLILNELRREVARTQTELRRIQFSVSRGVVYLWGEFWLVARARRLDGEKEFDILIGALVGLEKRLRRIPGVRDIYFRFTNVQKCGGFWRRGNIRATSPGTVFACEDLEKTEESGFREEKDEEAEWASQIPPLKSNR